MSKQQTHKRIQNWEVMTSNGWKSFDGIQVTTKQCSITISLANGQKIECSENHRVFARNLTDNTNKWTTAQVIKPFLYSLQTEKDGCQLVISVKSCQREQQLYDLTNVEGNQSYFTNGVLSHNCAHIPDFETLWTGLKPCLSTGGRVIMFSSPLGKNFFYQMWTDADTREYFPNKIGQYCSTTGKNGFHAIKLPWYVHPERDDKWFDEESKSMNAQALAQELLCVGPYSRIETFDGFKYAKDIVIGDLVLTHRGRFEPVTNASCRPVEENEHLYKVSAPCNREEELIITGAHPILGKKFSCTGTVKPIDTIRNECILSDFYTLDHLTEFQKTYANRFYAVLHLTFGI